MSLRRSPLDPSSCQGRRLVAEDRTQSHGAIKGPRGVGVFAEIYDNTGGKPHSLDVKAEIRSESGEVTPVVTVSRPSGDPKNGGDKNSGDTVRLESQQPLAKLMPGRYVLSVDVKSSAGGDSISRSVPFQIR